MDDSREVIVKLTYLNKSFGPIKAVDNVTLDIKKGEFLSLLGPSGCGKTTLLRLMAGFEKPDSGEITIDNKEMANVEPNLRPTNMVFQNYAIFPHLSVEQNVAYGLKRLKLPRVKKFELVNKMLSLVGLTQLNSRSANSLSGGQRQRVALARALILKPKVLLLDEPLSALDKKLREQMQIELRELQKVIGITFVLVTHDQEEALAMSDRIAVMFNGKVEQLATPQQLYRVPGSKRVASFIGNMNFFTAEVSSFVSGEVIIKSKALGTFRLPKIQFPKKPHRSNFEIGIRPEMFKIMSLASKIDVSGRLAKIVETAFFGETTQYKVKFFSSEQIFIISEQTNIKPSENKVGDEVMVNWDTNSFVVFSERDEKNIFRPEK